ncbi:MAG TPA: GGDEF domain-containing response regulator [Gammaproteobacteria bacterium]
MRLLLLEDHDDAADALSTALRQLDRSYEIRHARRLKDAEYIVATEPIDIALIDLTLPDADGRDGALALKAINPDLPLVALTGREFDGLAVDLIRHGVQDFLSKGETSVQRVHQVLQLAMERQRQERHLRYRACYDPLTGVLNQSELRKQLSKAIGHALRAEQLGAAMVVDLDNFKEINDTYGHPAGDAVLRKLAARLAATVRVGDSVGRMGGDEFVVVLEGVETREHAASAARKTCDAANFELEFDGRPVRVSASVGVALFPLHARDPSTVLKLADQAMYAAKRQGKGTFCFYVEAAEGEGEAGARDRQRTAAERR